MFIHYLYQEARIRTRTGVTPGIAKLLAEAIKRTYFSESVSGLFV